MKYFLLSQDKLFRLFRAACTYRLTLKNEIECVVLRETLLYIEQEILDLYIKKYSGYDEEGVITYMNRFHNRSVNMKHVDMNTDYHYHIINNLVLHFFSIGVRVQK